MNYRGLKRAARACLSESGVAYRKLTLLFLLTLYAVTIPCDALSYVLENQVERLSGLGAAMSRSRYLLSAYVLSIAVTLLSSLWSIGYQTFALLLSRKKEASYRSFFAGLRRADRYLILLLLEELYVFLWSLLFVLPGIAAIYRYRAAVYVMMDDPDITPSEAINVSKRLTWGHKLELFMLDLSFFWYQFPIALASCLPALRQDFFPDFDRFGGGRTAELIGWIVPAVMQLLFMAYVETTGAHAYNWLLRLDRAQREAVEPRRGWDA